MTQRVEGKTALIPGREKNLPLHKCHHELHTLLPILKTTLWFDLALLTTHSSVCFSLSLVKATYHATRSVLSPLSG